MKKDIDEFLEKNEDIKREIEHIARFYKLSDFVKVVGDCSNKLYVNAFLYNVRRDEVIGEGIDYSAYTENRLSQSYCNFLQDILNKEDIDKVFYIVAYHYLSAMKQLGYQFASLYDNPYPMYYDKDVWGNAIKKIIKYRQLCDEFPNMFFSMDEELLKIYNNVFTNYGPIGHHNQKYFSLLLYFEPFPKIVSKYTFMGEFIKTLNSFIFCYKAILLENKSFKENLQNILMCLP